MRAIAVLAVVLYHCGVSWLPGGFTGVDIFFVLSGFLITGLLWREVRATGRISFAGFYARRVRRLLPAGVLVLVATVIVAWHWSPPLQDREVTRDGVAAALFAANYRFAHIGTDYLASTAPPSPLQHYWSLSVEEQFYLLWPALLLTVAWLAHRRTRAVVTVLTVLAAGSFGCSLWLTRVSPPWAYFSLPTRAWELAAGGLVALVAPAAVRLPGRIAAVVGWLGLGVVIGGAVLVTGSMPYPGFAALVPVLGTAAVLTAGCSPHRWGPVVLLRRQPLQAGGKVSYSWYLWHWPFLMLAPAVLGHGLSTAGNLAVAAAAAGAAAATYVLLESPVRNSRRLRPCPRRSLALGAALTAGAVAVSAGMITVVPDLTGHRTAGAAPALGAAGPVRSPTPSGHPSDHRTAAPVDPAVARVRQLERPVLAAVRTAVQTRSVPRNLTPDLLDAPADKATPFIDGCHLSYTDVQPGTCQYADTTATQSIMLIGDSHATQWFPAAERAAQTAHRKLISLTKTTCLPIDLTIFSPYLGRTYSECDQWRALVLARIRADHPALVILGVARHYNDLYHFRVYSPQWISAMHRTVTQIRATGAAVMVLGPTPKPPQDIPYCLSAHINDATACTFPKSVGVNAAGLAAERTAVTTAGGYYVDISPWICTPSRCAVILDNLLVYRDDNHLATPYPTWLAPLFGAEEDAALSATSRPH